MTRPFVSAALLAVSLALVAGAASAQYVNTSKGARTLPLTTGFKKASQYADAARVAEGIAQDLLADAAASEKTLGTTSVDVAGLNEQIRREKAEYERAQASFDASSKKYLSELAAYQQRQEALAADIRRHGEQAAAHRNQPATDNYNTEAARLSEWAKQLNNQSAELQAEGQRLLGEHERVEAERTRLAEKRVQAEGKLKGQRDQTMQTASARQQQRAEVYRQLRVVVDYLRHNLAEAGKLTGRTPDRSLTLEQAEARLQRYESEKAAK